MHSDPIFIAMARAIGDRLVAEAVWHDDRCNWTGDELDQIAGQWQVVHRSVDASLYNGTAGIARFLAYLWRAWGDDRFRVTAIGALRHALGSAEPSLTSGLWNGAPGVACAAVEAGQVVGESALVDRGLALGRQVASRACAQQAPPSAGAIDVIAGCAGNAIAMAYLARRGGDARLVAACEGEARRLLDAACKEPFGWSWDTASGNAQANLCGAAHGASGVAHALTEAWALTGARAFAEGAVEALRYEKCWFDRRSSSWPDLRSGVPDAASPHPPSVFWCHGAAGIGMVRLRRYQLTRDLTALAEAGAALHAVRTELLPIVHAGDTIVPPFGNFSVCHGLGSLVELLLSAYQMLGVSQYLETAGAVGYLGIRDVQRRGGEWRCGVPGGGEHPGLMQGLAGIGMLYLRLADPAGVPSVTLFE